MPRNRLIGSILALFARLSSLAHSQVPPTLSEELAYKGLFAPAAHLGNAEVVRTLIRAGAPLDHINNLGWTAVTESIVLGDGGPRHVETLKALVQARANLNLADRQGRSPLELAQMRGYRSMEA